MTPGHVIVFVFVAHTRSKKVVPTWVVFRTTAGLLMTRVATTRQSTQLVV